MTGIELDAGDVVRWQDYPGAKWQTGRIVQLKNDDRLRVFDDYTGGEKGSAQQVRRHDDTGRARWINVRTGEPDVKTRKPAKTKAPPTAEAASLKPVTDRTIRRRMETARLRQDRGAAAEARTGRYDPAAGTWHKTCPYCKREFVAKRRSTIPCDRAQCRKRHSRRPR